MFEIKKYIKISILSSLIITFLATVGCTSVSTVTKDVKNTEKISYEDLSKYFTGYDGCFVLFDKNKNKYTIYNELNSKKEVSPCSTFKIMNSLIGLETKVLSDESTTFKWDSSKNYSNAWSKAPDITEQLHDDKTLKSAAANDAVWYFQELASRIGKDRMQEYLNKVSYGNNDISGGITQFWLQSTLKISPREQVEMLKKLYNYELPFKKRNVEIVKGLFSSNQNNVTLFGKTGTGGNNTSYTNGWFVGYIEKGENVYFFATNIEANNNTSGPKAKEITLKIIKEKNLY